MDDIRNLVDQVRFAPQLGEFKVYIIDEVHMLSASAFNAFLKTLEEPPRHAIFILATTEKHKIIPTILSRCQIFDFNRIQIDDIANHLAFIAKSENVSAETDALHIIAQKADGALRDACSIFDQIVSFAGNTVTYKAVIENLNILDYDYYFKATDAILSENISSSLLIFNEILNNGFDGHNFIAGIAGHFRNLLVSKDPETVQLLEVGNNIRDKYKEQAGKCSPGFLVRGLTILNKADIQYKSSKNQRLQVELALMQLCTLNTPVQEAEKKNDLSEKPVSVQSPTAVSKSPVNQNPSSNPQPAVQVTSNPVTQNDAPVIAKKPIIKTTTPSITQHINPVVKTEGNNSNTPLIPVNQKADPFTQQSLETAWLKYANEMKTRKANLGSALASKMPVLKDSVKIEFTINNKALEEAINEDKMNFLGFLRNELNNFSIQLELIMVQSEDKANLYTATDRYKRLAEKNPAINKFRQAFDLDIEF
ncbi:MAG: polymerase subunit gamma/tau [Bacteroidetes bacterium]|nr:polymerase subunit gamma/tau [Bacteroidota bacterium]